MQLRALRIFIPSLILLLSGACFGAPTTDPNEQIRAAVAQTLAALPTETPAPTPLPFPSPTPIDLHGIFCEYEFCIGHPSGMAFYDHLASLNPAAPSTHDNGFIVAYQVPALVISVIWLRSPSTSDPQFLLDTILDAQLDTRSGNLDVKLVRDMNVEYTSITTTISPTIPYGGAGAWTCGERVFAWKAYTADSSQAAPLFDEALARFRCDAGS